MSFLSRLQWRYAAKEFNPTKKVPDESVQKILDSIRLTPTSFGLQPYHVVVVTDQDIKTKIRLHAWDQPQITTCSHLLIFCARTDAEARIDKYIDMASGGDEKTKTKMQGYRDMMRGSLGKMNLDWASRQAYIALGFAMASCAELEIDSCPMEGFSPEEVDTILQLPAHMKSIVMLPIGYRTEDPTRPKVRFGENDLFEER